MRQILPVTLDADGIFELLRSVLLGLGVKAN